jgi:uncharacterized protein YbjT (DUF2867 family)
MVIVMTGASGFIGGATAAKLVDSCEIRNLTSHPDRNRFGDRVRSFSYDFADPKRMAPAFAGADVLVNTYYVRFPHGGATFERAAERSALLTAIARDAGVRKIVQVSVSRADEASDLPYYRNKGRIERSVRESGVDYTILRPAIVAGDGDILLNNIAYFLRRVPIFTIFGDGGYRVQPMTIDAFTDVMIDAIRGAYRNETVAVAGPRDWAFIDVVQAIRAAVGSRAAIVGAPAWFTLAGLKAAGLVLGDVVLTADEIEGLRREYLCEPSPVRVGVDLADWLANPVVRSTLGRHYVSELARHFDRGTA